MTILDAILLALLTYVMLVPPSIQIRILANYFPPTRLIAHRWAAQLPDVVLEHVYQLAWHAVRGVHADEPDTQGIWYTVRTEANAYGRSLLNGGGRLKRMWIGFRIRMALSNAFLSALAHCDKKVKETQA